MSVEKDIHIIENLPAVKIWGEDLDEIKQTKAYKGKFVITHDGRLFVKLYPLNEWNNIEFFHDMLVKELGVKDPESHDVKEIVVGGGKIAVELLGGHAECRLWGKSTIYGDYDSQEVNVSALETEVQEAFDLDDMPVQIIPDDEET